MYQFKRERKEEAARRIIIINNNHIIYRREDESMRILVYKIVKIDKESNGAGSNGLVESRGGGT